VGGGGGGHGKKKKKKKKRGGGGGGTLKQKKRRLVLFTRPGVRPEDATRLSRCMSIGRSDAVLDPERRLHPHPSSFPPGKEFFNARKFASRSSPRRAVLRGGGDHGLVLTEPPVWIAAVTPRRAPPSARRENGKNASTSSSRAHCAWIRLAVASSSSSASHQHRLGAAASTRLSGRHRWPTVIPPSPSRWRST